MDGVAYRSNSPTVLGEWVDYQAYVDDVRARRRALGERYDRNLMVNRLGFGHGTRVVGFQELETDNDGDILGEHGELRVPKVGPPYNTVVPNIRRKAGKDLAAELATLNEEGPEFTGMPPWTLVGLTSLAPALFQHDGTVWALWAQDIEGAATVDAEHWERVPLSAYYAAQEARDAESETAGRV